MACCVLAFPDAMRPIGIGHHGKRFVILDQFVDQRLGALVVDIVVSGAVHQEKIAL